MTAGPKNHEESVTFAIENFLADVQYAVQKVMDGKKISRADLAERLNCSRAYVSQMLSEDANLTAETIAKIFHALDDEAIISSRFLDWMAHAQDSFANSDQLQKWYFSECESIESGEQGGRQHSDLENWLKVLVANDDHQHLKNVEVQDKEDPVLIQPEAA